MTVMRRSFLVLLALAAIGVDPLPAAAQQLSSQTFALQYDEAGIRSLKRVNDVADTDYIAANGALGRLVIRYRTTRNGDWRELREMRLTAGGAGPQAIRYSFGTWLPTLAARSTGGAAVGAAGVRALNDGVFPAAAPGPGRGGGPGATPATADIPLFTWAGSRGATQWVQYTFPGDETVAKAEVFWTTPPQSWRLLYQDGSQWKEVAARGAYGVTPNAFNAIEFSPVTTMAMRVEVTMAPTAFPARCSGASSISCRL